MGDFLIFMGNLLSGAMSVVADGRLGKRDYSVHQGFHFLPVGQNGTLVISGRYSLITEASYFLFKAHMPPIISHVSPNLFHV